jgi:signal transduction histidine kinase
VLRLVFLVNAVALNLVRSDSLDRPVAGWLCVALMVAWTAVAIWAYADPSRRGALLLSLDLAVAVALLALTPVVKGGGFEATVPGFWVAGALLAWAVRFHRVGGLVAGAALCAVDVVVRDDLDQANYGNLFLLLIGGPIVGFMAESLQQMAADRDRAERTAAAAAERARLARVVHDGVLQVLALVQRRGAELGGDAELGRLAGEQESALRTLIRSQDSLRPSPSSTSDLAAELGALECRPGVTVATPGGPVEVEEHRARELVAVVESCLDNVTTHVGEGAPVWVLLEALPHQVEIDVRDEGPGIPDGRLEAARREGRLGVSESIHGRIRELGGTATLTSGSIGTEWTFVVPR